MPTDPLTPSSRESTELVINAGSNAVNARRNKNIIDCFRDRTPSYARQSSRLQNITRNESNIIPKHDAIMYMKETRPRTNMLTLLKSSSTRDLTRFMQASTTSISTASSSSSSQKDCKHCACHDLKESFIQMEGNMLKLRQELDLTKDYNKNLEIKIDNLNKRFNDLEKFKKTGNVRKKQVIHNTPVVQPTKFVAWMKLSNLWKHRPSIETLRQQNIYNDEPCFDTEIEMVLKHEIYKTVPKIVVDCCDLIDEKYRNSTELIEGIYRQCGDYNKIQSLRFSIDANNYSSLRKADIDIHTLTGVLKLFLREIKSPLISANEAKTFIGRPNQWLLMALPVKINTLTRLIRSLPQVNRDTMDYLFKHFNKLTKVPLQQASAEILSLSVTPAIFHIVQQIKVTMETQHIHQIVKDSEILADCVKIMIEYQTRIFECPVESKFRGINVRKLRKTLSHPNLVFPNIF